MATRYGHHSFLLPRGSRGTFPICDLLSVNSGLLTCFYQLIQALQANYELLSFVSNFIHAFYLFIHAYFNIILIESTLFLHA